MNLAAPAGEAPYGTPRNAATPSTSAPRSLPLVVSTIGFITRSPLSCRRQFRYRLGGLASVFLPNIGFHHPLATAELPDIDPGSGIEGHVAATGRARRFGAIKPHLEIEVARVLIERVERELAVEAVLLRQVGGEFEQCGTAALGSRMRQQIRDVDT